MEAITKRPVVVETPDGDVIAIRPIMNMVLGIDHRANDGARRRGAPARHQDLARGGRAGHADLLTADAPREPQGLRHRRRRVHRRGGRAPAPARGATRSSRSSAIRPDARGSRRRSAREVVDGDLARTTPSAAAMSGCDAVDPRSPGSYRVGIPAAERPAMYEANVGTTNAVLDAAIAAGDRRGSSTSRRSTSSATPTAGSSTRRTGATSATAS